MSGHPFKGRKGNLIDASMRLIPWRETCIDFISFNRVAVISAKNHKRQRRKRQSVTAKREKSQTPKLLTAILTLPNLA